METPITDQDKITQLVNYYKNNGLTIIGLNDSQGVNTTTTFLKKGLLEYLAASLTTGELNPTVINAFSLLINKTEHIDYLFKNNLSVEEIKLLQIYSAISAFEKVAKDFHCPEFLGQIGQLSRLIYRIRENDKNILITDTLRDSYEPTLIYSSGVNNLMREVGNNPFAITGDYKKRDKTPNYNYTLAKAQNPETLNSVISGMKKNFDTILSINDKTDIYTLGAYIPKSLDSEGMKVFRDLVIAYNEKLRELCTIYHITFINTEIIGKEFNNSEVNFHISSAGHNTLANYILGCMHQRKINSDKSEEGYKPQKPFTVLNSGPSSMIYDINCDYTTSFNTLQQLFEDSYNYKRQSAIVSEHLKEKRVLQKVKELSSRE